MVLAVVAVLPLSAEPAAAQAPGQYYSPGTSQLLGQPFLAAWATGGAFAVYGEPVSPPVRLGERTIQFFQFGALSVRAGREIDASATVSRIEVGRELLEVRGGTRRSPAGKRAGAPFVLPGADSAPPSRDALNAIQRYHDENGGADRFGKPLGQPFVAAGATQQWFANGRLEVDTSGSQVHPAAVGYELAVALGIIAPRLDQGNIPLLSDKRFHPFVGDGTVPEASGSFVPVRIIIPAIQVDAKIEQIEIVRGVMGTPADAWNVGWYHQLSSPGQWTNVVMAGHFDWWGIGPTVFYHLKEVKRGDRIYLVDRDGKGATYQVVRNYAVDADADPNPIVNDAGIEMLTLITCGGNFDGSEYLSRQIVRAKRI